MSEITGSRIIRDKYTEKPLGFNLSKLDAIGGKHTAKEISQQPRLWLQTWDLISGRQSAIQAFLEEAYQQEDLEVILTGAGTSAFIGNILQAPFQKNTHKRTKAIATTDLLSHPDLYFTGETTLLVSFARSGNSPESVATVNLAHQFCKKVYHLIITCNPEGRLVHELAHNNTFVFLLPEEADDQSLAMTGSFTAMLLAGLLISRIGSVPELRTQVERLAAYGETILENYADKLKDIASLDFQRAIFLGSGPLQGAANESDLKLQELTNGKVICKFDSFLGFRHGPKAVIDPSTLLVYLFSNNRYAHQYETDLVRAINAGEKGLFRIGVFETPEDPGQDLKLDLSINLSGRPGQELSDRTTIDEEFLPVCYVLPAQILGFYKSLHLGLKPDNPSENGTITRVVEGVNIYPFFPLPRL
ncbi:SIS domain-containing protein [Flavitalea flava]